MDQMVTMEDLEVWQQHPITKLVQEAYQVISQDAQENNLRVGELTPNQYWRLSIKEELKKDWFEAQEAFFKEPEEVAGLLMEAGIEVITPEEIDSE